MLRCLIPLCRTTAGAPHWAAAACALPELGVERIRLHPVPDPNTQFNLYETGAADIVFSVPSPILHRLRDAGDYGGEAHVSEKSAGEAIAAAERILEAVRAGFAASG